VDRRDDETPHGAVGRAVLLRWPCGSPAAPRST